MTLDEAIAHAEEIALKNLKEAEEWQSIWKPKLEKRSTDEFDKQVNEAYCNRQIARCEQCGKDHQQLADWLKELKQLREQTRWIPVKWHEITEEEREREEYPAEYVTFLDNLMPDDEEEILVTVKNRRGQVWVEKDACMVDDGYHLDSGYDWIDDVIAWMPLPKPYKAESEVQE